MQGPARNVLAERLDGARYAVIGRRSWSIISRPGSSSRTASARRRTRRRAICGSCSSRQLVEQRLHVLEIARIEALGEPPVNRSQQFARLLHLALFTPEPRKAHGGAQFPGLGVLLACHGERALKARVFAVAAKHLEARSLSFSTPAAFGPIWDEKARSSTPHPMCRLASGPKRVPNLLGVLLSV
jgi:hypothetical protein